MTVKVSSKYQVVIPQQVRQSLGLAAGSQVDVIVKGKIAYIVPVQSLKDIQKALAGKLDQKELRDKKDRL